MKTVACLIAFLVVISSCSMESQNTIRKKLKTIARADLEYIISETDSSEVMDSAYYKIVLFKYFPKDMNFSYKAVVDYYYFKNVKMKQVRKYRYRRLQKKWDRYLKKYENLPSY